MLDVKAIADRIILARVMAANNTTIGPCVMPALDDGLALLEEVERLRAAIRSLLDLPELRYSSHGAVMSAAQLVDADRSAADELQRLSEELDLP